MIAGFGMAVLVGVGLWWGGRAQAQEQQIVEIAIQAFVFDPVAVTVPVGTTVVWTNKDPVAHTVTDIGGTFDSGLFDEGATYSVTFTTPGTYTYYCTPHPMMIGTIEVTP